MKIFKEKFIYYSKYLVYVVKLGVWKLKKLFSRSPIYYLLTPKFLLYFAGVLFAVLVVIFGYPRIVQWLNRPRPLPLTTAPASSGYQFAALDKKTQFATMIGESKTNTPKVQATFGNVSVDFVLTDINQNISKPSKTGNKVIFKDVRTNVDLSYQTLTNGIKEDIIVKAPTEGNAFTFTLNNFGAAPRKIAPDTYGPVFYDAKGTYVFHFVKPFAVDAKGNRTDNVLLSIHKAETDQSYKATVIVNKKWLGDPARVYPITIDPTVVYSTSSQFAAGQLNRVTDTGSGSSPNLTTNYQELAADINTVGLWHMNEASGNILDSSGNSNTGTPTGTSVVSGLLSNTRSFNGTASDYITVSNNAALTPANITVEAWINPTALPASGNIMGVIDKRDDTSGTAGYILELYNNSGTQQIIWMSANAGPSVNYTLPLNTWSHVAVVQQGTLATIYINGQPIGSATASILSNYAVPLYFGRRQDGYYFNGKLDDIRISSVARTPEEIRLDASRRPYSVYTSDVIDLTYASEWNSLSWTELGVNTGDGETLKDATNLIAQWNFNATTSTATATNDAGSCSTSCNGTLTGFTNTTGQDALAGSGWTANNRKWGAGALSFLSSASNNVVVTNTAALNPSGDFSIEAWINPNTIANQGVFRKMEDNANFGYRLTLRSTGLIWCDVGTGNTPTGIDTTSTVTYSTGVWQHIVCQRSGTTMSLYKNGVLQQSATVASTATSATTNLLFGLNGTEYFSGVMDSTRLYSRALTASEILSNYQAGNVELQTRVGTSTDANDGTWEAWAPVSGEAAIASMDSDASNWSWDSSATYMPQAKSNESNIKVEGSGSLKQIVGQPQVDASTVGLWHMDETGGTGAYIKDSTTNANHGTPTGTTITNGFSNKAKNFNGSSDKISITNSGIFDLVTYTWEAWVKPTWVSGANGFNPTILALRNGTNTRLSIHIIDNYTGIRLWNGTGTQDYAYTFIQNNWYHIAFTYSSGTSAVYINGTLVNSVSYSQGATATLPLYIGSSTGAAEWFKGSIDEVRISNVARSAEEIAEAYRAGRDHYLNRTIASNDLSAKTSLPFYVAADRPGTYLSATIGESLLANNQADANTVGLWHLDEQSGSGAYIKDSSGNSNHGTPTGTTFTQGKIGKARDLNGSSDHIDLSNAITFTGNGTIELWVYIHTKQSALFTGNNLTEGYWGYFSGGNFYINWGNNFQTFTDVFSTNTWTHIAMIRSGTNYLLYKNGVLQQTVAGAANTGTLRCIGVLYCDGGYGYFDGVMDEIRISNTARTADQIRQAYEVGARTHNITIDFKAKLTTNLITDATDKSFTVDATPYGASAMGSNLFLGDKIIVRENVNGTEYIAQGTVNAVTASTGVTTVAAWDAGSTFPTGGFTANATVFKWQREYFDLRGSLSTHRDAVTSLTIRETDGSQGATVYLDDLRSSGGYLTTPGGSTITSSAGKQYFQYRMIQTSFDTNVSTSVTSATIDYVSNVPCAPTIGAATAVSSSSIQWNFTGGCQGSSAIIGFKVYDTSNTLMATCTGASITSCTETGLSVNTSYTRKVVAYNSYGNSGYSATATKYTLAAVPGTPTTSSPTATTVAVTPTLGTNPSGTQMALYVQTGTTCNGSGGNYIAANGSSNGATALWQTTAQWGTVTVTGLNLETTEYAFCTKARNGENTETAFSAAESTNGGFLPISGSFTMTQNTSVMTKRYVDGNNAARYVWGLDAGGTGASNSAVLTIKSGVLTVLADTTIVAGKIVFPVGSTGSIAMPVATTAGQMKLHQPLWTIDADADGFPLNQKIWYGAQPTGGRRLNVMPSMNTIDCYDSNANAFPGQTLYFTTNRGDGSWDYDCSGSNEQQYPTSGGSCCTYFVEYSPTRCTMNWTSCYGQGTANKWMVSVPACGASGTYVTDTGGSGATPTACTNQNCVTVTQQQGCH